MAAPTRNGRLEILVTLQNVENTIFTFWTFTGKICELDKEEFKNTEKKVRIKKLTTTSEKKKEKQIK